MIVRLIFREVTPLPAATQQIKLRRDTAAEWAENNPVLLDGEAAVDLTNDELRIGDGVTAWNDLDPATPDETHALLLGAV